MTLEPHEPADEQALRDAVGLKELDGLLVIHGLDRVELLVLKEPVWLNELHLALSDARARAKLRAAAVTPQVLQDARAADPAETSSTTRPADRRRAGRRRSRPACSSA